MLYISKLSIKLKFFLIIYENVMENDIWIFRQSGFRSFAHTTIVEVEPQFIGFAQPSVVFHIAMDHTS